MGILTSTDIIYLKLDGKADNILFPIVEALDLLFAIKSANEQTLINMVSVIRDLIETIQWRISQLRKNKSNINVGGRNKRPEIIATFIEFEKLLKIIIVKIQQKDIQFLQNVSFPINLNEEMLSIITNWKKICL